MAVRVIDNTNKELNETLTISVCNELIKFNPYYEKRVNLDSDIGRNTNFTISSEDMNKFSVSIISPIGDYYDSSSREFIVVNQFYKRYELSLQNAKSGVWSIHFNTNTNEILSATVSVTSQPFNPNAIRMKVWLKDANSVSQTPPIIFAVILRGSDAVIGAEVIATINKPNGTQSDVVLNNFNNIYWNYFTEYCGPGRYYVSVLAKNNGNYCQLRKVETPESSSGIFFWADLNLYTLLKPWQWSWTETLRSWNRLGAGSVPQFERQLIAGCFKMTDFMPHTPKSSQNMEEILYSEFLKINELNSRVNSPAPKIAKTPIATPRTSVRKKSDEQLNEIKTAKENLREKLLVVKKLVMYSKLTDVEKSPSKKMIEEIDSFIYSSKSTTMQEVDNNRIKLEELNDRFTNK